MMNDGQVITVALDVMGADFGPEVIIEGGLQAAEESGSTLKLVLVGKVEVINDYVKEQRPLPPNVLNCQVIQVLRMLYFPI